MRHTGIEAIGDVPWGSHLCRFYETPQDLVDTLVPYFKEGLEANERCLWVTSEPLTVREARAALSTAVPDLNKRIRKGQIEIIGHGEWRARLENISPGDVPGSLVGEVEAALAKGWEGLRVGWDQAGAGPEGLKDARGHEEAVAGVIGRREMLAVCAYPLRKCGPAEIIDIAARHDVALIKRDGRWEKGPAIRLIGTHLDLTQQKSADDTLRRERDFSATLLDTMGALVIVIDVQGRITRFSRECQRTTGYSEREVLGRVFWEFLVPEEDLAGVMQTWAALKAGDFPNQHENRWRAKDGRTRLIAFSNSALTGPQGDIEFVISTGIDITDRRRAEESSRYQALLLSQVHDGIIGSDEYSRINFWNKGAVLMYGFTEAEALGKTTQEILRPTYEPGEREKIFEDLRLYGTTRATLRTKHKDGTPVMAEVNSTRLMDESGTTTGYVVAYRDVTEHRLAEEALRESESLLRAVTDSTEDAVYVKDLESRWRFANPALLSIIGKPESEVLGRTDAEIYADPAVGEAILANDRLVLSLGVPQDFEETALTAHGMRIFLSTKAPRRDHRGRIVGLIGISRDITERKRMEEALRESEQKYRELVRSAPAGIYEVDFRTRKFISVNDAMCELTGYTRDELLAMTPFEILDEAGRSQFQRRTERWLAGEKPDESIEYRVVTRGGGEIYALLNVRFTKDKNGIPLGATVVAHDITERRKVEEELRRTQSHLENLIDYANAPIIVWDPQFKIETFNHAFERLTGLEAEKVIGLPLDILFPESSRKESVAHIRRTLAGERWEIVEIPILRIDGSVRTVLWNSANVYDRDGTAIAATIAQGQDITERKQAEEKLRRHTNELLRLNQTLTALSHSNRALMRAKSEKAIPRRDLPDHRRGLRPRHGLDRLRGER